MLVMSGTVVNTSVNLTRRVVVATHELESDRARVRFSDLLMCADLTDLTDLRSTNQPKFYCQIFTCYSFWHMCVCLAMC